VQNGPTDHTYYTQVNMTRTVEQILGLTPMNQFDLVASPMRTAFVTGQPPAANFEPWTHVPNQVPLNEGVTAANEANTTNRAWHRADLIKPPSGAQTKDGTAAVKAPLAVKALRAAWLQKKAEIFAGKLTKPDAEDPATVNHLNWYMSTGFTRPYPGEKTVRPPSDFKNSAPTTPDDDDN
jgi:hypothetical protein